jgi:hypothetical protein
MLNYLSTGTALHLPYILCKFYLYIRKNESHHQILALFFNWYIRGAVKLSLLCTAATNKPIVPATSDYDDGDIGWNDNCQGKRKYSEKTCPSFAVSNTNLTSDRVRTRVVAVGNQRLTA